MEKPVNGCKNIKKEADRELDIFKEQWKRCSQKYRELLERERKR